MLTVIVTLVVGILLLGAIVGSRSFLSRALPTVSGRHAPSAGGSTAVANVSGDTHGSGAQMSGNSRPPAHDSDDASASAGSAGTDDEALTASASAAAAASTASASDGGAVTSRSGSTSSMTEASLELSSGAGSSTAAAESGLDDDGASQASDTTPAAAAAVWPETGGPPYLKYWQHDARSWSDGELTALGAVGCGALPEASPVALGGAPCARPGTSDIQTRLWRWQHPTSCADKKFLIVQMNWAGIGSNIHVASRRLANAVNLGRIFLWHEVAMKVACVAVVLDHGRRGAFLV